MSPRGADRKTAILDAAVARIVAHGFEGLRVRDVAQDVGINNATLHHHYPTKAALVAAMLVRFKADFKVAGGVPDTGTLDARLAAYVAARQAQMRAAPDAFIVLNELLVRAARDADVREAMTDMQATWQAYLVGICRAAGLGPEEAAARADRCRRELMGVGLEVGLGP